MSAPETQNRTTETGSVIGAGFLLTKICGYRRDLPFRGHPDNHG